MSRDENPLKFIVQPDEAGLRFDKLVVRHGERGGRQRSRDLFASGAVLVNGRSVPKGSRARPGDVVEVMDAEAHALLGDPTAPLDVRAVSEHWIVVCKPAGQPSVALSGVETGTLANALLGHYPELAAVGSPLEAGLVQRLDNGTSGLLVAARTPDAHARLRAAIASGSIDKRYFAIVPERDLPGSGIVDWPLLPSRRASTVHVDFSNRASSRQAVTHWRVLRRGGRWALLEVSVSRAYRHQIRAHLAALGHPIVGDVLYGGAAEPRLGERHALHASYLAWTGDGTLAGFEVTDELPAALLALLAL
jgi:23S rRNA pseudouridine1911/1915/1917 synthase